MFEDRVFYESLPQTPDILPTFPTVSIIRGEEPTQSKGACYDFMVTIEYEKKPN